MGRRKFLILAGLDCRGNMSNDDLLLISRGDLQKIKDFAAKHGLSAELAALGIEVATPEIVEEHQLFSSDGSRISEHGEGECSLCHHECAACCEDGTGQLEDCQCACG